MFERFTDRARNVLVLAQGQANELGHNYIGTEHILLGMILEGEGVAAKVLNSFDVTGPTVKAKLKDLAGPDPAVATAAARLMKPPFTPLAKKTLELSLRQSLGLGHNYIGTEHLLLATASLPEGLAHRILTEMGADAEAIQTRVIETLGRLSGTGGRLGKKRTADEVLAEAARSVVLPEAAPGPAWSPATREVLADAARSVSSGSELTTTDVLGALVRSPQSRAGLVLARLGVTEERLAQELEAVPLEGSADLPVPPVSITVMDRTTTIEDPAVARFLMHASAEEIREALRRSLPGE